MGGTTIAGRGTVTHMSWRVGSDVQPPQMILQGFDVDIIISPVKDLSAPTPAPKIIASQRTQRHLSIEASTSSSSSSGAPADPWQSGSDPWMKYQGPKPSASNPGKTRLAEIKEQLCADVTSKVRQELETHATTMEVDPPNTAVTAEATEARFQALEVGVGELKQQNGWFHEAGDRMQSTEQKMGDLQTTMNQQQQELHDLSHSVQHSVKALKNDLSQEMHNSFQTQMNQLTALLEKRQCREH